MNRLKYFLLLAIFTISFIVSVILSFIPAEQACRGIQTTCYAVQNSDYSTSFGISNSSLGFIAFGFLSLITFSHMKKPKKYKKYIITAGILFGSVIAIYFLYIQFFVLNAICKYCVIIDIGVLLSLLIIFVWKEK